MEVLQTIELKIKVDKNKNYFLSTEKEHLVIYELLLGKNTKVSFIQAQAEEENKGSDYKTFGRTLPNLEQELKKLFTTGTNFWQDGDENAKMAQPSTKTEQWLSILMSSIPEAHCSSMEASVPGATDLKQ